MMPELQFVRGNLKVAYRASLEPQDLDLEIVLDGPDPRLHVLQQVRIFIEEISGGAAGGSMFAPTRGSAAHRHGPLSGDEPLAMGPRYHYGLRVAGVAPHYLRHVVEKLGMSAAVSFLSIRGSLPLDDSTQSVRENDVVRWLGFPRTHLGAFAAPFAVREHQRHGRRGFVRLRLLEPSTNDILLAFEDALLVWGGLLLSYGDRTAANQAKISLPASAGRGGAVLAAQFEVLSCEHDAARDALINVIGAFHERAAQVGSLEVGIPR